MSPRLFPAIAAAIAIAAGAVAPAAAAERTALVIANSAYQNAPTAITATRDAQAVAAALEAADYQVTVGLDLRRSELRSVMRRFEATLDDAEKVVVFVSGHALRSSRRSYFAPTDASADELTEALFDAVPIELMLRLAQRGREGGVVFLDAAQFQGFEPKPFVEPGIDDIAVGENVLVVSAAAPGRAIRRSPTRESRFARVIVDRFLEPDMPVMQAVREVGGAVWAAGGLAADFAVVEAPGLDDAELQREIELAFWQGAERSGRAEDYEAYLARFPGGEFTDLARNRLRQIEEASRNPDEIAEEALGLDRRERRALQRALSTLGFDTRGVDGIFGPATRRAIGGWQRRAGVPQTGFLAPGQPRQIIADARAEVERRRAEEAARAELEARRDDAFWASTGNRGTAEGYRAYLDRYPEGRHAERAQAELERLAEAAAQRDADLRRERVFWQRMAARNTAVAYRSYLGRYPDGLFAPQAKRRLARIERAERAEAQTRRYARIEAKLGLSRADRRSVERRLHRLGYPVGRRDGIFDGNTRRAIEEFQRSYTLPRTGYLDKRNLVVLVRETRRTTPAEEAAQVLGRLLRQLD